MLAIIGASWGLSYITMKVVLKEMTPFWMASFRFLIAFLCVALIFVKRLKDTDIDIIKGAMVIGFFDACIFFTLLQGLKNTTATNAGFLCSTSVVIVPILHAILSRKMPERRVIVCCLIAIVGIGLMSIKDSFTLSVDDMWCLACAFSYAALVLSTNHYSKKVDSLLVGIWQLFFTFLYVLVVAVIFEPFNMPSSGLCFANLMVMALICTSFCFVMQTVAQKYTTPEHASLMFCLEPISSAILGFLFFGEMVGIKGYLGAACILFAVVISCLNSSDKYPKKSATLSSSCKNS